MGVRLQIIVRVEVHQYMALQVQAVDNLEIRPIVLMAQAIDNLEIRPMVLMAQAVENLEILLTAIEKTTIT